MMDRSVLISGAGIAGPTLAFWLKERGFTPTIVEHATALRSGGYAIDFWGLGYDIAERMGVLSDVRHAGYNVQDIAFVDERGRKVGGFEVDVFRRLVGGRYVTVLRSDLARLVFDCGASGTETIFGDSVEALRQDSRGVDVVFAHAGARRYDLVIGADGQHSKVRELTFGPEDRFETYLGYMVAAFVVDGYRPRDEFTYVSYSVPGRQVGRFALRGDRTVFLFVFASERPLQADPHDTIAHKAAVRDAFGDIGWECPRILAAMESCDDVYFDRVSQIRMETWHKGRVSLVGDAAFAPSLMAGQGSALAMTAAYVLAGELERAPGDFAVAFRRYESLLRPFMIDKQIAAARFAGSFAPRSRWGLVLRNVVTRAFAVPLLARLVLGNSLLDRLTLPEYPPAAA